MNKFLVWFKNGVTKHFESEEEMLDSISVKEFENVDTITNEFFDNGKYIGEVDYSVEEYFENF